MRPDRAQPVADRDQLKADAVLLENLLLTTHPVLNTDLGSRLGRLSLSPCSQSADDALTIGLTIGLELDSGAALWVDLPSQSISLLAGVAEEIDFEDLPGTLRNAALEAAVAPLTGPLTALIGKRVSVSDSDRAAGSAANGQLSFELRDQDDGAIATVRLDAAAFGLIKTALERLAPADRWSGAEDVPVRLSAEIAVVRISVSELSALRIGDLVLLPAGIDPGAVSVRAGGRIIAAGSYEDRKVRIEQLIGGDRMDGEKMDVPMNEDDRDDTDFDANDDADGHASADGLDVDDIELSMCFGLGTIAVKVADLRTITEGYTFSLPPSEAGEVVIAVSGQEIGRGEIVQIDDRLGVRVTKLEAGRHE